MCSSPCEFLEVLLICLLSVSSFFLWRKRGDMGEEEESSNRISIIFNFFHLFLIFKISF